MPDVVRASRKMSKKSSLGGAWGRESQESLRSSSPQGHDSSPTLGAEVVFKKIFKEKSSLIRSGMIR